MKILQPEPFPVLPQNYHPTNVPGFPATRHCTRPRVRLREPHEVNAVNLDSKSGVAQWRDLLFS